MRAILGAGALVLLLVLPAAATSGDWVPVRCPVCESAGFEVFDFASTNSFGGVDRDFCKHAVGDQVFLLAMATCPKCAYTGYLQDFDAEQGPRELIQRLKRENPLKPALPLDPAAQRATDIPAWVRWDLYLQVLDLRGDVPAASRAYACLQTAWTQRFDVEPPPPLDETLYRVASGCWTRARKADGDLNAYADHVAVAKALEQDAGDEGLVLTGTERRLRWLAAAREWQSRGEAPDATRVLVHLRALSPVLPSFEAALAADLEDRIARERTYYARAVPLLEEAVRDAGADSEAGVMQRYLLGEIHRKLDHPTEARTWLEALRKVEGVPEDLRAWIEGSLAKLPPAETATPAR